MSRTGVDHPWGEKAYVLVGALSHSGRFRAVFCEQPTLGHLAAAIHPILLGLGGSARNWRTDRMATAVIPGTDRLNPRVGPGNQILPRSRIWRRGTVRKRTAQRSSS